jgi:hypothetical protein
MYISRLLFHTIPGNTGEVEKQLAKLQQMVISSNRANCRILHTHFASPGAPDSIFEQEAPDLENLERDMAQLTKTSQFQNWSRNMSKLLTQSPKREIYIVKESDSDSKS